MEQEKIVASYGNGAERNGTIFDIPSGRRNVSIDRYTPCQLAREIVLSNLKEIKITTSR